MSTPEDRAEAAEMPDQGQTDSESSDHAHASDGTDDTALRGLNHLFPQLDEPRDAPADPH